MKDDWTIGLKQNYCKVGHRCLSHCGTGNSDISIRRKPQAVEVEGRKNEGFQWWS